MHGSRGSLSCFLLPPSSLPSLSFFSPITLSHTLCMHRKCMVSVGGESPRARPPDDGIQSNSKWRLSALLKSHRLSLSAREPRKAQFRGATFLLERRWKHRLGLARRKNDFPTAGTHRLLNARATALPRHDRAAHKKNYPWRFLRAPRIAVTLCCRAHGQVRARDSALKSPRGHRRAHFDLAAPLPLEQMQMVRTALASQLRRAPARASIACASRLVLGTQAWLNSVPRGCSH